MKFNHTRSSNEFVSTLRISNKNTTYKEYLPRLSGISGVGSILHRRRSFDMSHELNDSAFALTTTAQPWWRGSSFPYSQYKDLMPEDQFAKLLAMHENSAANAALYVAVVLAVYMVLLSLLLCRYVRRRPPIRELPLPALLTPSTPRSGPSVKERIFSCITKPYDVMRHCTLRSGTGVASISSEEIDEERSGHGNRRDSTVIRMNQLRPHSSSFDAKSTTSMQMVNMCTDPEEVKGDTFHLSAA